MRLFPLPRFGSPALGPWPWVTAGARCVLVSVVLAMLMVAPRRRGPERGDWPAHAAIAVAVAVAVLGIVTSGFMHRAGLHLMRETGSKIRQKTIANAKN